MLSSDVFKAYAQVLVESRERGDLLESEIPHDRRIFPRMRIRTDDLWLNTGPEYVVRDISASGIAFSSNFPLQRGARFTVAVGTDIHISAQVIDCKLVTSPDQYTEAEFNVHCRFSDAEAGMELLVRAKRSEFAN